MTPRRTLTTAKSVDALKPAADRYIVRDSDVSGLELRVQPDGRKMWTLRYRANGERRRLKLGQYHPQRMTLADARRAANRELRKVDGGTDPQLERLEAKRAAAEAKRAAELAKRDSIDSLCEGFIERHAKV